MYYLKTIWEYTREIKGEGKILFKNHHFLYYYSYTSFSHVQSDVSIQIKILFNCYNAFHESKAFSSPTRS